MVERTIMGPPPAPSLNRKQSHMGYGGHYSIEAKPLVSQSELEAISNNPDAANAVIHKYNSADRKSQMVLVSERDFVDTDTDGVSPRVGILDDIYQRISNADDFKRGDFMFTPMVTSIMTTCAVEVKQAGIRNCGKLKSRVNTVASGELSPRISDLRKKRNAVRYSDRREGRVKARVTDKSTIMLRKYLKKQTTEKGTYVSDRSFNKIGALNSPIRVPRSDIDTSMPLSNPCLTHAVTSRPFDDSKPPPDTAPESRYNQSGTQRKKTEDKKVKQGQPKPRPRRPNTAQPSRYNQKRLQMGNRCRSRSESMDSLFEESTKSSSDGDEFNTFDSKGAYLRKKRGGLMGTTTDPNGYASEVDRRATRRLSRPPTAEQMASYLMTGADGTKTGTSETVSSVAASEGVSEGAKMAAQFFRGVLVKNRHNFTTATERAASNHPTGSSSDYSNSSTSSSCTSPVQDTMNDPDPAIQSPTDRYNSQSKALSKGLSISSAPENPKLSIPHARSLSSQVSSNSQTPMAVRTTPVAGDEEMSLTNASAPTSPLRPPVQDNRSPNEIDKPLVVKMTPATGDNLLNSAPVPASAIATSAKRPLSHPQSKPIPVPPPAPPTTDLSSRPKTCSSYLAKAFHQNSVKFEMSDSVEENTTDRRVHKAQEDWLVKRMEGLLSEYVDSKKQDEASDGDKQPEINFDEGTISIEMSLLFRGYQTMDKNKDGFLSADDIYYYCKENKVHLSRSEIENVMWLMDDNRRGYLTFEDIMSFYVRKRREFLASGQDYKMRGPVEAEEVAKLKLRHQQYVLTECDMHSQPLLLFRILFFTSMQDSKGEIHLLTGFQNLSQLFGRAAEEQFNCIFLKKFSDITDDDRQTLSDFVEYMKLFRVKVKRTKVIMREHTLRKAALVRFSTNKGKASYAADRRNAIVDDVIKLT
mmetsp:Transcript_23047/g.33738  ORF Transcript_23047/g.33738 Transcript_23047/m.33738 type:complete len:922 (+) Transcript_23047:83-2848(+)